VENAERPEGGQGYIVVINSGETLEEAKARVGFREDAASLVIIDRRGPHERPEGKKP